mmetsp:Transcript_15767/g.47306  ORF Transcript_15767/g.47306 Transcript_15767/m.47306 type:complete len:261 (-) Transcript_15767:29-811(-)
MHLIQVPCKLLRQAVLRSDGHVQTGAAGADLLVGGGRDGRLRAGPDLVTHSVEVALLHGRLGGAVDAGLVIALVAVAVAREDARLVDVVLVGHAQEGRVAVRPLVGRRVRHRTGERVAPVLVDAVHGRRRVHVLDHGHGPRLAPDVVAGDAVSEGAAAPARLAPAGDLLGLVLCSIRAGHVAQPLGGRGDGGGEEQPQGRGQEEKSSGLHPGWALGSVAATGWLTADGNGLTAASDRRGARVVRLGSLLRWALFSGSGER